LRAQLTGTLAPEALEREIEARYREFMLFTAVSPAGDRRQRLFEEAYAADTSIATRPVRRNRAQRH